MENIRWNNKYWLVILWLVSFGCYLVFGMHHLTQFETTDEHYWMYNLTRGRLYWYWKGIISADFDKTRINDKPGVTLALVTAPGFILEKDHFKVLRENGSVYTIVDPQKTEAINFAFRFPLLLFNGLFSLFFFWILKKITGNEWIALWSAILILLSPVLLGISQIINPDSLLWVFGAATLFSYVAHLQLAEKKFAWLTALFFGLALLSKYTATIFFPFLFLALVAYLFFRDNADQSVNKKQTILFSFSYLGIVLGALIVFSVLMPAVFVHPRYLYEGTIGYGEMFPIFIATIILDLLILADAWFFKRRYLTWIFSKFAKLKKILPKIIYCFILAAASIILINWMSKNSPLPDLIKIPFDERQGGSFAHLNFMEKFIMEPVALVFSLTPLTLAFIAYFWIKNTFRKQDGSFLLFIISLFTLIYFIALISQKLLSTIRYNIMLYPLVMVLAAFGLWEFFQNPKLKVISPVAVSFAIIGISLVSLWQIKPFYFNYTNFLLPKDRIITGAWGYGGYEAAQYLNSLPNAEKTVIWSDYYGVCSFYKGPCVIKGNYEKFFRSLKTQSKQVAYFVKTRRGAINNFGLWSDIDYQKKEKPVWEMIIDGRPRNYIRIYEDQDFDFDSDDFKIKADLEDED